MKSRVRLADDDLGSPALSGTQPQSPTSESRGLGGQTPPAVLVIVWMSMVAIAVAGRAWQPAAHVTPLAAVSLAAGAIFPSTLVAASVPVTALAIGNLFLPPYGSVAMAVVVFAALSWPVLLGRVGLLGTVGRDTRWRNVIGGALASSLVFFFATNVTFWLLSDMYPRTAAGLFACLVAALPFHRWMPVGDVAWSLGLFGVLSAAVAATQTPRWPAALRAQPAPAPSRPHSRGPLD